MTTRLVAGCMTGTSIDSIDAALVRIEGQGLQMSAQFLRGVSTPLGDLAPRLRKLANQEPMTAGSIADLSRDFSLAHVPILQELLKGDQIDLVAVHGQTVYHKPPVSWQMLTPTSIARALGVPVVFDLRAADLAAGGQGAPITPLADWVLFDAEHQTRCVVNLGGFCNISELPGIRRDIPGLGVTKALSSIRGKDVCACNHLLDLIARTRLGSPYDKDGQAASCGTPNAAAVSSLSEVLRRQAAARRSLGTGDELAAGIRDLEHVSPPDLARSAVEAVAAAICEAATGTLILAGGGTRNTALVAAIRAHSRGSVTTTVTFGIPVEYREAVEMAVLGALCQDRVAITLPAVTGVPEPAPLAGSWVFP